MISHNHIQIMPYESTNMYSMEELNARAAVSEAQVRSGHVYSHAGVMETLRARATKVA